MGRDYESSFWTVNATPFYQRGSREQVKKGYRSREWEDRRQRKAFANMTREAFIQNYLRHALHTIFDFICKEI